MTTNGYTTHFGTAQRHLVACVRLMSYENELCIHKHRGTMSVPVRFAPGGTKDP